MAKTVIFLFHLFLVNTLQIQGTTLVTHVFVKTGEDLILNVTEAKIPTNSRLWLWQFTGVAMVTFSPDSQPEVENSYTERIEVLEKNYSVKLKNLQKSDMGIYTAKVLLPKEQKLTEYNVTVQDPVSPVNLTLNCTSSTSSFCILPVTCSAEDSSISSFFRCESQTCNKEEGERNKVTKSGASLQIHQLKESIVCNHSNQVSWDVSIEKIEECCTQYAEPRNHYWYIVTIILLLASIVCIAIKCHRHRTVLQKLWCGYSNCAYVEEAGNKDSVDNTIYVLHEVKDQTEKLNEEVEDEVSSPTTTYSVVGPSLIEKSRETRGKNQPESVYAQITKPSR